MRPSALWPIIGAAVFVAVGAPADAQAPQAIPVAVAKPLAKRITRWDEYSGRFEAVNTVEVRARVSGLASAERNMTDAESGIAATRAAMMEAMDRAGLSYDREEDSGALAAAAQAALNREAELKEQRRAVEEREQELKQRERALVNARLYRS